MKIETQEGFISLVAESDAEAALLSPIADAINASDKTFPAELTDNLEGGTDHRIINGVLTITPGAPTKEG
jgi:hypothetical protein